MSLFSRKPKNQPARDSRYGSEKINGRFQCVLWHDRKGIVYEEKFDAHNYARFASRFLAEYGEIIAPDKARAFLRSGRRLNVDYGIRIRLDSNTILELYYIG